MAISGAMKNSSIAISGMFAIMVWKNYFTGGLGSKEKRNIAKSASETA